MSYQTKQQAIGYILKSTLDVGATTRELVTLYRELEETIDNQTVLDNYTTIDYAENVGRIVGLDNKRINAISSNLYYLYDTTSVEEAELLYQSFVSIFKS